MAGYYAKSDGRTTVAKHLEDVAFLAGEYGRDVGMPGLARTAGWLHDTGKYGEAFQDVLSGKCTGVDHACPSAALAYYITGGKVRQAYEAATAADYAADEANRPADKLRTMGRKQFIPFGLYEVHGFVSANLAEQTGFDEQDLNYLFEAMANMYDATRSSSKGTMSVVSPVIIFKHVGEPGVPADEAERSAKLGRAPAYKLFELVDCRKRDGVDTPACYRDYNCTVDISGLPKGVEIGFLPSYGQDGITWGRLPDGEDWVTSR